MRIPNEPITITLPAGKVQVMLACLRMIGTLASGDDEDPDTNLTAEVFETYLLAIRPAFGDPRGLAPVSSAVVDSLSEGLLDDMLTIVHRNYRQTKEGLKLRDGR